MAKKKRSNSELEKDLKTARSAARNAQARMKEYKKGIKDGLDLAREARRDN